ncbi:thyrostimulin alpha-2 subunit [Bradysia coprophila]|uniref:thyrostimulin alpha-2 subunit n=1 Tax=Bradysia coprophila TaxID=38358 RepID=UPI00187D8049|nr:thyrostimulin alpha-2 subunit [Bradysia coprophila]
MTLIQIVAMLLFANAAITKDMHGPPWMSPGCHKVGHTRKIEIPDCVEFTINTNACRGFCESYAVPSPPLTTGLVRAPKPVTSIGQCCNIMESEDVNVRLNCLGGPKNLTFKSATKCSCYHCKKD